MRMGGPEVRLGSQEARAHVLGPHSRQKGALQGLCCPVLRSPQPGFCVESREGWGWPVLPARTARHLREVREARLLALGGSPVPKRGQCQSRPHRACWPGCPGAQWGALAERSHLPGCLAGAGGLEARAWGSLPFLLLAGEGWTRHCSGAWLLRGRAGPSFGFPEALRNVTGLARVSRH